MEPFLRHVFTIFLPLGFWGLVIVGILDSSFVFMPLGTLATYFGRHILRFAAMPAVHWFIVGLIVVSVGGCAISIYGWIKKLDYPLARRSTTPRRSRMALISAARRSAESRKAARVKDGSRSGCWTPAALPWPTERGSNI